MPDQSLLDDLRLAHMLADQADAITMARFKASDLQVTSKPDLTPVSYTHLVALLGGVLLASLDTEGKPNLGWRLRTKKELLGKDAAKRKAELERDARGFAADTAKTARRSVRKARKTVEGVLS